ncbi:putative PAP-specific phosphatase, mitochondrial [Vigna radiata var. radiata]|uniref:PAP-specific phosphatase, mitochondrial n=1 Tax=Vigna radiata var. radiata TaxID=3916 RepID=A0A1S3VF42_VIGRR|nr:putative PAP-specific phosphatase, mitochondrial [Vigna radiata var. radiata]
MAMDILRSQVSAVPFFDGAATRRRRSATFSFNVRATLPLPRQNAKYYKELEAAVDVVQKACNFTLHVQSSLFSIDGKVIEKNDQTPVTVADFGVQALISLELNKLFPSIPLVAEEDSAFLRSRNLAGTVFDAITATDSSTYKSLTQDDVLEAIDRGSKEAFVFGPKPATYWLLDPIDGTRGFLKAGKAFYVVGLALVVEGEVVIGVMGCPTWKEDLSEKSSAEIDEEWDSLNGSGTVMVAHKGCGTWMKSLNSQLKSPDVWTRCFVDGSDVIHKARFCISDSEKWEALPLSPLFKAANDADKVGSNQIHLLRACCGSLCKYLMVASGRASIFILRAKQKPIIMAWDHAVGIICVQEAGGKVTDWNGSEIDLAADRDGRRVIYPSDGILVTNGHIHDQVLQIIYQTAGV